MHPYQDNKRCVMLNFSPLRSQRHIGVSNQQALCGFGRSLVLQLGSTASCMCLLVALACRSCYVSVSRCPMETMNLQCLIQHCMKAPSAASRTQSLFALNMPQPFMQTQLIAWALAIRDMCSSAQLKHVASCRTLTGMEKRTSGLMARLVWAGAYALVSSCTLACPSCTLC